MNENVRKNLLTFLLSISVVCLVFSKYVLSMSIIGVLLVLLFTKELKNEVYLGFNPKIFQLNSYKNLWPFTGFILYFAWIVTSILWSGGEYTEWIHDVQSKLGIVGIAVIFALLPRLDNFRIVLLHQVFGGTIFVALLLVLYVYIPGYEDITLRIGRGRPIPTPIDHVRFSIMVAYACLSFIGFVLEDKKYGLRPKERVIMGIFSLIFFAFCHLLAVRTGLVLLYAGIFTLVAYYIFSQRRFLIGFGALLALAMLPFIAYHTVESFKNKVKYTKYDIEQLLSNQGTNYSDGDRLRSIQQGIAMWKNHPVLGYGAGEYKQAVINFHTSNQVAGNVLLPHNQYIRAGMAYGWIGLILLLSGFVLIFLRRSAWQNLPMLFIALLFFLSLFVEANMERYYALTFFMIFLGINGRITSS